MEEQYLQTDKGNIFYRKGGQGEAVLLLHGNGEDSTIFENQYSFLLDSFTVFAMDTRGHGQSDLFVEILTFQRIAEDIVSLLEKHNLHQVHIIGYSDGGNIGLYIAAHYPEKVRSLITLGANFEVDGLIESALQEIMLEKETILQISNKNEKIRRLCIINLMVDELSLTSKDLRAIKAPVLVLAGENDLIKKSQTKKIADHISKAVYKFIPGGGHDFFITDPTSFEEASKEFYKEMGELK
ncbi:alpha/beta hydrolase [Jeotgalibaca sp. MA1X17-3]|uniref:alpha/beta fold hydrolase n=1 Tax=Jeotgalibaca sp. MA1X17-3 TaxID=2908211 RepID=UPI001F291191|nr:alpha/beta hydrolase [Jeotgalibaca sp. MA1X17-3]UJF16415.1 alpha/beta hydrolase [Jeotgalibaca sp. MA1X17-3]